ncbi:MAG: hypothetical protein KGK18_06545, partial [Burkholderiales bacterium]|nr:hypothetical protein [Burkholderiales bacterium]
PATAPVPRLPAQQAPGSGPWSVIGARGGGTVRMTALCVAAPLLLGHALPGCPGRQTAKVTPKKHSAVTAEISSLRAAARVHRPAQAREDAWLPDKAEPTCCDPETSFD